MFTFFRQPHPTRSRLSVCELDTRDLPATFTIANGNVAGLIAAIKTANSNNQNDTIQLAANGTYSFAQNITGETATPVITSDNGHTLTINGNGATLVRGSTATVLRFFQVNTGNLTLTQLTLSGGRTAGPGAALAVLDGSLTVRNATLMNSVSTDCEGGGLYAGPNADAVSLQNVTVSGNTAAQFGGGVSIYGGAATLTNVTVANNRVTGAGTAGVHLERGTLNLRNALLANNTAPNAADDLGRRSGTINVVYSLVEDGGTAINGTSTANILNADPNLGTLANNGGATKTHLLLNGSKAINKGSNTYSPGSNDQRGQARILNGTIDMGAVEVGVPVATKTTVTSTKNPTLLGEKVTFTATVLPTASAPTATGTVTFYVDGNAVRTVPLTNGKASWATTTLTLGKHTIYAKYTSSSSVLLASTSATLGHDVIKKHDGRHWER